MKVRAGGVNDPAWCLVRPSVGPSQQDDSLPPNYGQRGIIVQHQRDGRQDARYEGMASGHCDDAIQSNLKRAYPLPPGDHSVDDRFRKLLEALSRAKSQEP